MKTLCFWLSRILLKINGNRVQCRAVFSVLPSSHPFCEHSINNDFTTINNSHHSIRYQQFQLDIFLPITENFLFSTTFGEKLSLDVKKLEKKKSSVSHSLPSEFTLHSLSPDSEVCACLNVFPHFKGLFCNLCWARQFLGLDTKAP